MRRTVLITLGVFVVVILVAMFRQHQYYADVRRNDAQDHQQVFYGGDAFHVLTLLKSKADTLSAQDIIEEVSAFKRATESLGNAQWVYAGKTVVNGQASEQIGPANWTAGIFVQYPSREAYLNAASSDAYQAALAAFENHYAHGARRSMMRNLFLPQFMLFNRLSQGFGSFDGYPFEPSDMTDAPAALRSIVEKLRAEGELGTRGMVVLNLQKRGTPEQQAADAEYVAPMIALMARLGYGPMHLADAEQVPGSKDFDAIANVFYPGTLYFADLISSTFYQEIIGDKQLGDNQSIITVPILDLL